MNLDLTITLGTLIQTAAIVGGGLIALGVLRATVATTKAQVDATNKDVKERFEAIHGEIKKIGDILIGMARFDEKLSNLDKRVTTHGRKIDDLSRGEGFIRSHRQSVDGEYE